MQCLAKTASGIRCSEEVYNSHSLPVSSTSNSCLATILQTSQDFLFVCVHGFSSVAVVFGPMNNSASQGWSDIVSEMILETEWLTPLATSPCPTYDVSCFRFRNVLDTLSGIETRQLCVENEYALLFYDVSCLRFWNVHDTVSNTERSRMSESLKGY